jgi:hypothetical protein
MTLYFNSLLFEIIWPIFDILQSNSSGSNLPYNWLLWLPAILSLISLFGVNIGSRLKKTL